MSRLTIRAEEDGVKAVWYGERDVFLEGEIGYAIGYTQEAAEAKLKEMEGAE